MKVDAQFTLYRFILCILRFDILFGACYTDLTSNIREQLAVSQHLLFPKLYRLDLGTHPGTRALVFVQFVRVR